MFVSKVICLPLLGIWWDQDHGTGTFAPDIGLCQACFWALYHVCHCNSMTLLVAGCLLFHASLQHWSRAGYWRWPDRTLRNPKAQSWPGLFSFQFVFEKKIISFQFRLVCCNQYAEELTIRKPTSFYLQALHLDALSDVDNSTQSLLMFTGNESVHGLYDILLNYK